MTSNSRIGDLLVTQGVLTRGAAETVATEGLVSRTRFASTAVTTGRVQESAALEALAQRSGFPAADLGRAIIETAVIRRIPEKVARDAVLLAFAVVGNNLLLAMRDPGDKELVREVEFASGLAVRPHVALHVRLREIIPAAYGADGDYYFAPRSGESPRQGAHTPIVSTRDDFDIDVTAADEPMELSDADLLVEESEAAKSDGGARVLVVEDEPDIRQLIVAAVESLGHTVITADAGLAALQRIKSDRPELIVLDAMLPEVHGFEICRKVKQSKRFGHTPVLMISAIYRGWRIAEDIKNTYDVDDFLEKPFRLEELKRRVQALLERKPQSTDESAMGAEALALLEEVNAAYGQGDYDDAFRLLRQLESIEPFSPKIQYLLGQVLEHRQRIFQAIYHYERAIELQPRYFAAANSLAMLYQRQGFRNKAVEMWERALQAAPNDDTRDRIKQRVVSLL